MVEVLAFINSKLEANNIPYEYGIWTKKVDYPYCVGSFTENDYRFEDECTTGVFTLDCWSRDSIISLTQIADKVKVLFDDLQKIEGDYLLHIRYGGANIIPSGEQGLFRVSITLHTKSWKGTD